MQLFHRLIHGAPKSVVECYGGNLHYGYKECPCGKAWAAQWKSARWIWDPCHGGTDVCVRDSLFTTTEELQPRPQFIRRGYWRKRNPPFAKRP